MRCINAGGRTSCKGEVTLRTYADRDDGKHFARCEAHHAEREQQVPHHLELTSPLPPRGFDPAAIGESWDESW